MSAKGSALSMRINPELRWTIELVARQQFRSATSVVEAAISAYAGDLTELARSSYHPDQAEQAKRLAASAPHLLTFDERELVRSKPGAQA